MNGLVVLAACVCASSAQLLGVPARAFAPVHQQSHQFHAQDEFGQFTFGYAGGPSARTESRDAYGVTQGSYQYVDANGILQTVNYIADPVNGFRVSGTNLPAVPVAAAATPLVAPVFNAVGPAPVVDTPEVAAAKAEFQAAFDAAVAANAGSERKRRSAQLIAAPTAYAGYPFAAPYPYAAAGLPAAPIAAAALPYNAVSAPGAAREAVLTTIKLNPGHATFYRVD
jgi:hypothetical protein